MALFVGPKHSGKTVAACSVLKANLATRLKVLDADGRIRGILGSPWIQKDRIDYDYYPPRTAGNNKGFFERVNGDLELLLDTIVKGKCPYETFVGDSLTAITKNFLMDALPLTHAGDKGRTLGAINMSGPQDYGFESSATDQFLSFLRSIPLNVILTAHVIDKYDKPSVNGNKDMLAESIVVGEKLSLRDKISANVSIYFDHIFRFDRKMVGGQEKFFVEFISDIACTSFPGLMPGRHDITGKDFYKYLMGLVNVEVKA